MNSLRTIAVAQAYYRDNDRDGNGKADFWVDDVAGLYVAKISGGKRAKLIELSIAAADTRPVTPIDEFANRAPKAGYWYRAIRHEGDAKPNPLRFAVVSYPDGYPETGTMTYIIDETNTGWQKDLGHGNGLEVFPKDPAGSGWRRAN